MGYITDMDYMWDVYYRWMICGIYSRYGLYVGCIVKIDDM